MPDLSLSVFDSSVYTESTASQVGAVVNSNDSIAVVVVLSMPLVPELSVSDSASTSENYTVKNLISFGSIESLAVTENSFVHLDAVQVNEVISVTESLTIAAVTETTSVADSIAPTESITVHIYSPAPDTSSSEDAVFVDMLASLELLRLQAGTRFIDLLSSPQRGNLQ